MNSVDILIPDLLESVADAIVATWHKKPDDAVVHDKALVGVETNRMVLEVSASADGILNAVSEDKGTAVTSRQTLGHLREGSSAGKKTSAESEERASTSVQRQQTSLEEQSNDALSPVIRRLLAEHNLDASTTKGTGVGGRLTREGMGKHLAKAPAEESAPTAPAPAAQSALTACSEERVPMIRLCKRVAERLLEAKNSIAMLTTFNEVNIRPIIDLRRQCDEAFERRHGIRLGFTSFYMRAVVETLKRYPEVNTSVDGNDVIYHNYFDVNTVVSTPCGLVTPALRDVDILGMADIEKKVRELAVKGHDGKLAVEDLIGDNFIIINGGAFGSLMSTPVISPPQSAVLGMHAVEDRPITMSGQVEILPVMYLALSYDHRLIDDCEPVGFLVTVKELPEDPTRLLLDVQQLRLHLHCRPTWIGCRSTV